MKKFLLIALTAVTALVAQNPVARLSVSTTPDESGRMLVTASDGRALILDNPTGEAGWFESFGTSGLIGLDTTVLGLPRADVHLYSGGPEGIKQIEVSRSEAPWSETTIEHAPATGPPCAVYWRDRTFVFSRSPQPDRTLIALRKSGGEWERLSALEEHFRSGHSSGLACGIVAGDGEQLLLAATMRDGSVRLIALDAEGTVVTEDRLANAAVRGNIAIASAGQSSDLFAINESGLLLRWHRSAGSGWVLQRANVADAPVLLGSPAVVRDGDAIIVAVRSRDGNIAVWRKPSESDWSLAALAAPDGQPVIADPVLTANSGRISGFAVSASGKPVVFTRMGSTGWTAAWFRSDSRDSQSAPTAVEGMSKSVRRLAASSAINGVVDSIAIPNVAPPVPPHVISSLPRRYTSGGVDFDEVTTVSKETVRFEEIVALNPNADSLWPGSVVQGNTLPNGMLTPIGLPRAPMTITMTTLGHVISNGPVSQTLQAPDLASATAAMRALLPTMQTAVTPENTSLYIKQADNIEKGLVDVGINAKWLTGNASATFKFTREDRRTALIVRFVQQYYTIAAQPPASPATLFASTVTTADCARYMQMGNPPAYVSNITYGRMLTLMIESRESRTDVEAAIKAAVDFGVGGGSGSLDVRSSSILRESTVQMLALGGAAGATVHFLSGNIGDTLVTYIKDGARFSASSPGVPIAYTVRYLKDLSTAYTGMTTNWTTTRSSATRRLFVSLGRGPRYGNVPVGVHVRPGDLISVVPGGRAWSGVWFTGWTGPEGWVTWAEPACCSFPSYDAHPFSLLFRVGANKAVFAGTSIDGYTHPGSAGPLHLLINTDNYYNGDGSYYADITVGSERTY